MKGVSMHWRLTVGALGTALMLSLAPDPGAAQDIYERPLVLPVPEDARVEVKRDLVYKRADGEELLMDVFLPEDRGPEARLPAVLFVHGGPLPDREPKDAEPFVSYGQHVAASGRAAVTFSNRFTSDEMVPTAAEDVDDAFRYVREHADELSVDPDRICIWAFSAGGMFVTPYLREPPKSLRCVVLYYAVMDPAAAVELGMERIPDAFQTEYDATEAVSASEETLPRIVIARAGQDFTKNSSLDRFAAAALDANAPLDLMNHAQGEHGFDVLNDDERSREILRRSLEIVGSVLSNGRP